MSITLPTKFKRDLAATVREFGYRNERDFIADAVMRRIQALKREQFIAGTSDVRAAMKKKGLKEGDIFSDFDAFLHARS